MLAKSQMENWKSPFHETIDTIPQIFITTNLSILLTKQSHLKVSIIVLIEANIKKYFNGKHGVISPII